MIRRQDLKHIESLDNGLNVYRTKDKKFDILAFTKREAAEALNDHIKRA